jgi:predicted transcriptional regulator
VHHVRRRRGSLEESVLAVLAGSEGPLTPAEMRDRLGGDLAYTTVMTVLSRLADKSLIARTRAGRGYAYAAIADRAEIAARQMQKLLDAQQDRAGVLARFVGALHPGDEVVLADMLTRASEPDPAGEAAPDPRP